MRQLVERLRHRDPVPVEEIGAVDQHVRHVAVRQAPDATAVAHRSECLAREVVERIRLGGDQVVERLDVTGPCRLDQQQVVDAHEVEGRILAGEAALHQLPHLGNDRQRHVDLDAGQLREALGRRRQVEEDTPALLHHPHLLGRCPMGKQPPSLVLGVRDGGVGAVDEPEQVRPLERPGVVRVDRRDEHRRRGFLSQHERIAHPC